MDKSEWQTGTGETWAEEWRRTDRSFGHITERLLGSLRGRSFSHLVDIGCGAGELSLAVARGHPQAEILGVDVSPPLIAAARERGANLPNVRFVCQDAAVWRPGEDTRPSLMISRHGVMFFADPAAAFASLNAAMAPDGELIFSCFRAPAENPFMTEVVRLLPAPPAPADPHAPGPFAFADSDRVRAILEAAGWRDVTFEAVDFPMITGAGLDPVSDAVAYFSRIGPASRHLGELEPNQREMFTGRLRDLAEANCRNGIVSLPAAAWIARARKG